jgi:hypothetical protein
MYEEYYGEQSNGYILFVLKPRLTLSLMKSKLEQTIQLGDIIYHDITHGESNGFYDWLRNFNGEIVGLRYSPHLEKNFLLQLVTGFSYIEVAPGDCFMIFFGVERTYDPSKSADQDFGGDIFYSSSNDNCLFSVGTKSLDERDIITILNADAEIVSSES